MTRSNPRRSAVALAAALAAVGVLAGCAKAEDKPAPATTSPSATPTAKSVTGGPNNFSPKPLPPLTPTVPNDTDTKPGA